MTGRIDRVVVTFDSASEDAAAIDTAVRLAARAKAPLHGVFVEDEDLLAMVNSPVARQATFSPAAQPYTPESIELHLRMEAERARSELFEAAERQHVNCTFEIVRGAHTVVAAGASERDLVVAGALGRPIAGHFRLECRWWSSIDAVSGAFLLAQGASGRAGSIVLWLRDHGDGATRLFDTAVEIAEARDSSLVVVCPPHLASSTAFERWLADRLEGHEVALHVEIAPAEPAALRKRIGEVGCHLLGIEAGMLEAGGRQVQDLVADLSCDVLIVR